MPASEYRFPVVRGVQAGREHYVAMCPLRLIPRLFLFDEQELPCELRAQRTMTRARLPAIARYLVQNPDDYVLSALTASVDGEASFHPVGDDPMSALGHLYVAMNARLVINDGQHRRGAIELALRERPELSDESVAVVLFVDSELIRSRQIFADLNRHAVRPGKSLGILYDGRDRMAEVTRLVALRHPLLRDIVEMERSNLAPRSRHLFTLSGLHASFRELLAGSNLAIGEAAEMASRFWNALDPCFPEWQAVRERRLSAGEVRKRLIHSHGVVLQALGMVGHTLLTNGEPSENWPARLAPLRRLDWSRDHARWTGRTIVQGHVRRSSRNVALTANALRSELGMPLGPDERQLEAAFVAEPREFFEPEMRETTVV